MHKRCSTVHADPCRAPHNVIRLKIYRIAVSKNAQSRDAIAFQNKQIQPLQSLHLPGNVVAVCIFDRPLHSMGRAVCLHDGGACSSPAPGTHFIGNQVVCGPGMQDGWQQVDKLSNI